MNALSLDLRQRIADALEHDAAATLPTSQARIAQRFAVSLSSVERIARKKRQQESLAPKPSTGRKPLVPDAERDNLARLAASRTDWTLQTLVDAWQQQGGGALSQATMCRTLGRAGFSHKKSAASPPKETRPNDKTSVSR